MTGAGKRIEPMLTGLETGTGAHDIALTYLAPTNRGVRAYGINLAPEVKNTVMFYRNKTITTTLVNVDIENGGLASLASGISGITK